MDGYTVEQILPAAGALRAKVEAGQISAMSLLDALVREKAYSELLRRRATELEGALAYALKNWCGCSSGKYGMPITLYEDPEGGREQPIPENNPHRSVFLSVLNDAEP